jgi:cytosine/adenosine deaminase-related metal-dependent hydrolase
MTPSEEELLGSQRSVVCYTPAVSARAGNSARIGALEAAGASIVLGSDEFAADMVEVMRLSILLERVRTQETQTPAPADAWRWATRSGYTALGFQNAGALAPGALADLILIDVRKPHLAPSINVRSSFVHQGQASDVSSVMVNGKWLMKRGQIVVFNEQDIVNEAENVGRVVWRRAVEKQPDLGSRLDLH